MTSTSAARQVLKDLYGIDAELTKLYGEFDDNYLAVAANGEKRILKIMRVGCDAQRVDIQCQAMAYLQETAGGLNLPSVIPTSADQLYTSAEVDGTDRIMWLLRYCEGELLEQVNPQSDDLLQSFGRTLALVDVGLSLFEHPAMRPGHEWELTRAGAARRYSQHVAAESRGLVDETLARFESETVMRLGDLRHSVIHNDANDGNVLVNVGADGKAVVDGLIDFGDISYQPMVCDAAIALSYVVLNKDDPVSACASFLKGYNDVNALSADEIAVLQDLTMARLAVSISISAGRRSKDPDDPVGSQDKQRAMRALAQLARLRIA